MSSTVPRRTCEAQQRRASALVWMSLWVLPALAYQCIWVGVRYSPNLSYVLYVPIAAVVLLGGRTVILVFEAVAETLTGRHGSVMMDNLHVFLVLVAIQSAALAAILRFRGGPRSRDPVALTIGVALLVNALLAAHWPWWGS